MPRSAARFVHNLASLRTPPGPTHLARLMQARNTSLRGASLAHRPNEIHSHRPAHGGRTRAPARDVCTHHPPIRRLPARGRKEDTDAKAARRATNDMGASSAHREARACRLEPPRHRLDLHLPRVRGKTRPDQDRLHRLDLDLPRVHGRAPSLFRSTERRGSPEATLHRRHRRRCLRRGADLEGPGLRRPELLQGAESHLVRSMSMPAFETKTRDAQFSTSAAWAHRVGPSPC